MSLIPKKIPRKIPVENISGYVYCPKLGLLPCADWHDKGRLMSLSQIFLKAVIEKRIIINVGFPQTKAFETKTEERKAYVILAEHLRLNTSIFKSNEYDIFEREVGKEKILYLTKDNFDKIIGKK